MKREEAISTISNVIKEDENCAVISSTGLISRELFAAHHSSKNFYMTGSMGLTSSIGLGLAMIKPNKKIVIVEGDGSLLMNLNSLATIGHFLPSNFIHIVLDNNSYDSSAGEPTVSSTAKLDEIARTVGYKESKKIRNVEQLRDILQECLNFEGPIFLLVEIEKGGKRDLPRILNLVEIKEKFMQFLL